MYNNIIKALNIEPEESKGVFLLIVQSIFIGIFYGAFEIAANTLFLDYFEPSMLTQAYAVSGVAGIIMTVGYTSLQERIKFSHLAIINLLFIGVLTAMLRFSLGIIDVKYIAFALLVVYGPFKIIALVGFWGSTGRLFSLRQGKRLFGLIDTGWILGIILSSYIIPILLRYKFPIEDVLLISTVSILLAVLYQFMLGKNFNLNTATQSDDDSSKKEKKLQELLKNPYIFSMSVFIVLSMITAFFIQYSFIYVTKDKYPGSTEFAMFYGLFIGTMMIFILLIKTFVYSRLIKTYGLKVALILSPALLIFFTVLAAIVGSIFGYTSESATFTFFFLLMALNKLFGTALKDAIEVPSFKILYQSIEKSIRYAVQAKVDGTINEIAALSSGIILAILGFLPFFKTIHFSYCLVFILVAWFFYAAKLFKQYQDSLQQSLKKGKAASLEKFENISHIDIVKNNLRQKPNVNSKILLLKALELIDPIEYEEHLLDELNSEIDIPEFFLSEISRLKIIANEDVFKGLKKNKNGNLFENKLNEIKEYYSKHQTSDITKKKIETLTGSVRSGDRIIACKFIKLSQNKEYLPFLNKLLRDFDVKVKIEAIKASAYVYNNEIISLLIDLIEDNNYKTYVSSAIKKIGKDGIDDLEQAFYKTDIQIDTLIRIVKIFGGLKEKNANKNLINKIDHINNEIQYQSIVSLNQNNFKPDETSSLHIHESIEQLIGIIAWNVAAQLSLEEANITTSITDALKEEQDANYEKLFLLLSLAYDKRSIDNVRENLESGTSEGIGFGIELLDQFVLDELKNTLFPILEDSSKGEKIKQLQNFYPVDRSPVINLYYDIINRDINQINHWTKACALYELSHMEDVEVNESIIAQMFHPSALLNELAGKIIFEKDKNVFDTCLRRLDKQNKDELSKKIISKDHALNVFLFDIVLFIKQMDSMVSLPGNIIYKLVKNLDINVSNDSKKELLNGNSGLIYIYEGAIKIYEQDKLIGEFTESSALNLFNYNTSNNNISMEITKNTKYFTLNRLKLSNLLFEDTRLLRLFINS